METVQRRCVRYRGFSPQAYIVSWPRVYIVAASATKLCSVSGDASTIYDRRRGIEADTKSAE